MNRKIYFLTKLEQEMVDQRRKFAYEIIKENIETKLLLDQKFDEQIKEEMRKTLARGENVTIGKSLYLRQSLKDEIFFFFKKFFGCVK